MSVCTCCGKELIDTEVVMLELDQRLNVYHDFGKVPTDKSQGFFPFGKTCAKNQRRKAHAALSKLKGDNQ